ncbi:hypothetical protein OSB04_003482 [Centaurea solstitialis]|uniref:SBP-type domain-containing protein n=1 Tax=Centaurea solstitialis TaxID=347529 RepID=A0AA38WVQ7_9ASTR|nr:hypothetical protein OSB04_003482 [Centaurea solstitialis]
MESWSFDYVGKGLVSDECGGKIHSESKSQFLFGNNMIESPNDQMGIHNQGFGEMCFPQIVGNSLLSPQVMAATPFAFLEENESSSKLSTSDLNLNRIVNQEIPNLFTCSKVANNLSSSEVSMPSKQTRIAGSPSPVCQVLGCNKSLVSCKDYHKRHKVCEIHSKTAKVIVKGVEQRFCQQCSRFHLLSEFDDGKRSCRKRLADHNERRRKPHVGRHSDRHGRLLQSYRADGKTKGLLQRTRATSSMYHDDIWHIKLEDKMANDLRSISSTTQLHSESLSSGNLEQPYPSLCSDSDRYSLFFPIFNESPTSDLITMDPTPMGSDSRSALSLLSSQSQGGFSSTTSSQPLMIPFNYNGERAFGVSNNVNPLAGCEDIMNPSGRIWCGDGSTIDLLQLLSELERVEHRKEMFGTNGANIS